MLLDMHAHVLPGVDDGAKDIADSLAILAMMKKQGITDVIATPHFYPQIDNPEDFRKKTEAAFDALQTALADKELPRVYPGSEVLYFPGIGHCASIADFCLNHSRYLLLELCSGDIGPRLFEDLAALQTELNITPIIAHVERYYHMPKYRRLLQFLNDRHIYAQLNASSLFTPFLKRISCQLIKHSAVHFLGTDAHSVDRRPPQMQEALALIQNKFGAVQANRFLMQSNALLKEITVNTGESV